MNGCYECFYFIDDGGELFGENPHCLSKTQLVLLYVVNIKNGVYHNVLIDTI